MSLPGLSPAPVRLSRSDCCGFSKVPPPAAATAAKAPLITSALNALITTTPSPSATQITRTQLALPPCNAAFSRRFELFSPKLTGFHPKPPPPLIVVVPPPTLPPSFLRFRSDTRQGGNHVSGVAAAHAAGNQI